MLCNSKVWFYQLWVKFDCPTVSEESERRTLLWSVWHGLNVAPPCAYIVISRLSQPAQDNDLSLSEPSSILHHCPLSLYRVEILWFLRIYNGDDVAVGCFNVVNEPRFKFTAFLKRIYDCSGDNTGCFSSKSRGLWSFFVCSQHWQRQRQRL